MNELDMHTNFPNIAQRNRQEKFNELVTFDSRG